MIELQIVEKFRGRGKSRGGKNKEKKKKYHEGKIKLHRKKNEVIG